MKISRKILAAALVIAAAFVSLSLTAFASQSVNEEFLTPGASIKSDKSYAVTSGVTERKLVMNDKDSNQVIGFVLEADLNNPDISVVAGYKDMGSTEWGFATLMQQAVSAEKGGADVVAGVNADQYDVKTGQPAGLLIMNGRLLNPDNGRIFFAILNDGTAVIRKSGERTDDIKEAVGAQFMLIENGRVIHESGYCDTEKHPRTAVGIKPDGSVVFIVVDGRQSDESAGITINDLADTMRALGCVDAVSLDGGSSSTMISQHEYYSPLSVRNEPSKGIARNVSSTLLVCTAAQPTGQFDHISFEESEYAVAPGNAVKINYYACDVNGYSVKIPEGSLQVEDSSYGKIVGGSFVASKKKGETNINYVSNGTVIAGVKVSVTDEAKNLFEQFIYNIEQFFVKIKVLIDTLFDVLRGGQL